MARTYDLMVVKGFSFNIDIKTFNEVLYLRSCPKNSNGTALT